MAAGPPRGALPPSPQNVSAVAILLHGKIGIWSVKSAFIPGRDRPPSKYLANAISDPPKAPPRESNVSVWDLERWKNSMHVGFARFASRTIRTRIIDANRHMGLRVDVFLHSWHPDFGTELDSMYAPIVASQHDKPMNVHKVQSHHISMKLTFSPSARGIRLWELALYVPRSFRAPRTALPFALPLCFRSARPFLIWQVPLGPVGGGLRAHYIGLWR